MHQGVDIKANFTDTIYAAFDGKVRVSRYDVGGYGNFVVIRHYNGLETVYGHMSRNMVVPNQYVIAGQPIGMAGSTGRSSGVHLHFEMRFCGIALDPQKLISFENGFPLVDTYRFNKSDKMTHIAKNNKKRR
jgi:murein DD-endopeptidase MepM/ murein hydrolase activator NlpD